MKIGIIGAGFIGGSLTRTLTALGHEVRVSNSRAPETLAELAAETGATAVWAADAADNADLVIVSIPQKNVPDLAPGIVSEAKPDAPVIETNNYYPQQRDGYIADIENGMPESVWVAKTMGLPTDTVFKVFNGIYWKHLLERGVPAGTEGRMALPIAGTDGPQKELVFELIEQLGFDAVDGGTLEESWRQQPGTPAYGKRFGGEETKKALTESSPERTDDFKALPEQKA
ncbi:MAG: oxidoreductase [Frankiales bacterium]|nr:oxidoreductase [Frankiales bacterium]